MSMEDVWGIFVSTEDPSMGVDRVELVGVRHSQEDAEAECAELQGNFGYSREIPGGDDLRESKFYFVRHLGEMARNSVIES